MRVTHTCRAFFTLMFILACSVAMAEPDTAARKGPAKKRAAKKTDILSMIPDNAYAFVVINKPAMLFRKAATLTKRLEVPSPDPVTVLRVIGPAAKHVDMTRPAAIVLTPDGVPLGGAILVPVTDFAAFVKASGAEDASADLVKVRVGGDDMVAASYKGYALLTDLSVLRQEPLRPDAGGHHDERSRVPTSHLETYHRATDILHLVADVRPFLPTQDLGWGNPVHCRPGQLGPRLEHDVLHPVELVEEPQARVVDVLAQGGEPAGLHQACGGSTAGHGIASVHQLYTAALRPQGLGYDLSEQTGANDDRVKHGVHRIHWHG